MGQLVSRANEVIEASRAHFVNITSECQVDLRVSTRDIRVVSRPSGICHSSERSGSWAARVGLLTWVSRFLTVLCQDLLNTGPRKLL
jgi:hypothetical protein